MSYSSPISDTSMLVQGLSASTRAPSATCSNVVAFAPRTRTSGATDALRRPKLSAREIEVVITWLRADSKAVAGQHQYIEKSTVNTHIGRVRQKYAAVGRVANTKVLLAVRLIQDGHISIDEL